MWQALGILAGVVVLGYTLSWAVRRRKKVYFKAEDGDEWVFKPEKKRKK